MKFKIGNVPWNTNIKMPPEFCEKMKKPKSADHKHSLSIAMKGNIPWNTGLTAETDIRVKKYGDKIKENAKYNPNYGTKNKTFSEDHKRKIAISQMGENGNGYIDGRTSLSRKIYKSPQYKKWRTQIFRRDKYTCVLCGGKNLILNAHHLLPFSVIIDKYNIKSMNDAIHCNLLWDIRNGVCLCESCHTKFKKIKEYKTVLITGGHGSIAEAIKNILIKNKFIVFSPSHREMDVSNEYQIKNYINQRKIDILINNAGYINPKKLLDETLKNFNNHIKVNLIGAFLCSKYTVLGGCNTIITITSTSAFESREDWGSYCISKVGALSLVETLYKEGINSFNIAPARTKTNMRNRLFPNEDQSSLMDPKRIGAFVVDCLSGKFSPGSHIIVKKNNFYVLPMRECPK